MKNIKREYGQFYSKNKNLIKNHIKYIKDGDILIDPFAGDWDLLKDFKNEKEAYDIDPKNDKTIKRDTLLEPVDYRDRFIITNPPFLNSNKTKNKEVFELYGVDDLYKASLKTIIKTGERGIIILPAAFWFNEKSSEIRKEFLEKFKVEAVDIFNEVMFEESTYTVCSFYFEANKFKNEQNEQKINFNFTGNNSGKKELIFSKSNKYSLINNVKKELSKYHKKIKIIRYTDENQKPTNIFLNAIDTSKKIYAEIKKPFKGSKSDRAFLTFVLEGEILNTKEEEEIVNLFNNRLNEFRVLYMDSFLSNYRNNGRKRISFTLAYEIFEDCLVKVKQGKNT